MNWMNDPATERQRAALQPVGHEPHPPLTEAPSGTSPNREIAVGKTRVLAGQNKEVEVYTMTLGGETIELLPLKNWGQLDLYKWRVRGKLPGTPAGLEITADHVKLTGETVSSTDPEGCSKLEKLFNEWLALEKESLQLARKKAQQKPVSKAAETSHAAEQHRFQAEVDKEGQVHIKCLQGKEVVTTIGLNLPGFHSLINQGLMRKPHVLKVGALHDWVELDGKLYSFEKGGNDSVELTNALNHDYRPPAAMGQGKDIIVFANAASSTGFDIQFTAMVGGVPDHRRRPLGEESLELLQDPNHCGLLHPRLVVKLTRPTLIFKNKTPDGGEQYLAAGPENTVRVSGEDGALRLIDLSQPVNYLRLSPIELTAVFNHPAINKHGKIADPALQPKVSERGADPALPLAPPAASSSSTTPTAKEKPVQGGVEASTPPTPSPRPPSVPQAIKSVETSPSAALTPAPPKRLEGVRQLPNLWLKPILAQQPIRSDWLDCLIYGKIAERFGNSCEGEFGGVPCWSIAVGDVQDLADPEFKGIFLAERVGFGFLHHGYVARFDRGNAFLGKLESPLEGVNVGLLAVGMDLDQRFVFVVSEDYRAKFAVLNEDLTKGLDHLNQCGARLMSIKELLQSPEPVEVIWTAPAEQDNPADPRAVEHNRPAEMRVS
jgi:hypothetical protein